MRDDTFFNIEKLLETAKQKKIEIEKEARELKIIQKAQTDSLQDRLTFNLGTIEALQNVLKIAQEEWIGDEK
jgi:hypothetical protein